MSSQRSLLAVLSFLGVAIFLGVSCMIYITIKDSNDPDGETAQLANRIRQEQRHTQRTHIEDELVTRPLPVLTRTTSRRCTKFHLHTARCKRYSRTLNRLPSIELELTPLLPTSSSAGTSSVLSTPPAARVRFDVDTPYEPRSCWSVEEELAEDRRKYLSIFTLPKGKQRELKGTDE
jgi:hypothetical protein